MPEETSLPSIVIATPTGAYPIASAAWNNLGEAFFAKDVRHLRSLLCERRPTVLLANLTFDGGQFLPVISEAKRLGCTVLVVDCYATKFNAQELAVIRSVVEEMGADAWFDLRSTFDPTNPLGATKSMHDVIKNLIRCQQFKKLDTVESTSVPT